VGDWACTAQALASPIAKTRAKNFVVIAASVNNPQVCSQCISANDRTPERGDIFPGSPSSDEECDWSGSRLSVGFPCASVCMMLETTLGCLKWAAVGFVVAFALMKLFEASHIHDDIPKPAFKIRQTKRATFVLSAFAAMLSALVWLLVQKLD
jgi:hypothetical protein